MQKVIKQYENLVYKIAISKHRPDLFEDLLQEGFVALCRAHELFVSKKRNGCRKSASFMTYASQAIHNNINQYIITYNRKGLGVESLDDYFDLANNYHVGGEIETKSEHEYLMSFVNKLPERTRQIIIKYFNMDGKGYREQQEIAKEYGIGGARVSQIVMRGLRTLNISLGGKYADIKDNGKSTSKIKRKANNLRSWTTFNHKFKADSPLRKRLRKAGGRC